jgi:hypothetical protein
MSSEPECLRVKLVYECQLQKAMKGNLLLPVRLNRQAPFVYAESAVIANVRKLVAFGSKEPFLYPPLIKNLKY